MMVGQSVAVLVLVLISATAQASDVTDYCDGVLNESHQGRRVVSHSVFPLSYDNNYQCQYRIQAPAGKRVVVVFEHFNLEAISGCTYDRLEVFDGESDRVSRKANLCGRDMPEPIKSSGASLFFKFRTDGSIQHSGYSFRFYFCESECCHIHFMREGDSGGAIQSTNFPGAYPNRLNCTYHFIAESHASRVKLSFSDFELERHAKCSYDYVTIRDGLAASSCTSRPFCADDTPPTFVSSSNALTMQFNTDPGVGRRGFRAEFCQVSHTVEPPVDSCLLMNGCCQGSCSSRRSRAICSCPPGQELMPDNTTCECPTYCDLPVWSQLQLFQVGTKVVAGCSMPAITARTVGATGSVVRTQRRRVEVLWSNGRRAWHQLCRSGGSDLSLYQLGSSVQAVLEATAPPSGSARSCAALNGGCDDICRTVAGSPVCACLDGYFLAADQRSCLLDMCQDNRGGCTDLCTPLANGTRQCSCSSGFKLRDNQRECIDLDECGVVTRPCEQQCINSPGSFRCECNRAGYRLADDRRNCSDIDECKMASVHHCVHTCVNTRGSFFCECNHGYQLSANMRTCDDVDECFGGPGMQCQDGCENLPGSYRCVCRRGYRLTADNRTCVDIAECTEFAEVILNRANCLQCLEQQPGYSCTLCRPGYAVSANRTWCNEIDECASNNGGCLQQCSNAPGNFSCSCFAGYAMLTLYNSALQEQVEECVNLDECATDNAGCTDTCTDAPGTFRCSCPPGARLLDDGKTCVDIDECEIDNAGCSQTCSNTPQSFACTCRTGYEVDTLDPAACVNVDECAAGNGGCQGDGSGCEDLTGSFRCTCEAGYRLLDDQRTCEDVDECQLNNGGCQHTCNNTDGSYMCSCFDGYRVSRMDSLACVDVNECAEDAPCNMTCSNLPGSFLCTCEPGYELMDDGTSCRDVNECERGTSPCDQYCSNTDGSFICSCRPGFQYVSNSLCQDIDECSTGASCCNQGCANNAGSYRCLCGNGYYLDSDGCTCRDIQECSADNGGCEQVCVEESGSYRCACRTGFAQDLYNSTQCHDINECRPGENTLIANVSVPAESPCEQRCENTEGGYSCSCRELFRLRDDRHTCTRCPTCETFTELESLVHDLVTEVRQLREELAALRRSQTPPPASPTPSSDGSGFDERLRASPISISIDGDGGGVSPDFVLESDRADY